MNYQRRPPQKFTNSRQHRPEEKSYQAFFSQIPDWVQKGIDANAVKEAEKFGKELAENKITSTQIRKVFNEIKEIEMRLGNDTAQWSKYESRIIMLKPKMAYLAKRENNKSIVKNLSKMIRIFIDEIIKEASNELKLKAFKNFSLFFEALLAYHRAYEK